MNDVLSQIRDLIDAAEGKSGFLDILLATYKHEALQGKIPLVLFGAGSLGRELCLTLMINGISPVAFCDNSKAMVGNTFCNLPVISFEELKRKHKDSLILIATQKFLEPVTNQLLENGFESTKVLGKKSDFDSNMAFVYMYANPVTQYTIFSKFKQNYENPFEFLKKNQQKILQTYNLLADKKSKDLLVSKLALLASNKSFELFKNFMMSFSEPVLNSGLSYNDTEDDYYFNNDVLSLSPDEVYVDVGAFDGDTVQSFINGCKNHKVDYKYIYAFEPDPQCYNALVKNVRKYKNVSCHQLGIWSESKKSCFTSSENAFTTSGVISQAAAICNNGNIEIQVVSIDEFLKGEKVTFIKMDPGGNVIPEAVKGAARTIAKYKPKLALGAYHALESIFEIPLLVNDICPEYKLYLRHGTCHLCDTDLFATI